MEEVLIYRLQNQDKTVFSQLYDQYAANLYGIILRIVKDECLAEEVLQDCFVKIWSSINSYDKEKGRFFTWLVTIARHIAIDKIRTRSFRQGKIIQKLADVSEYQISESFPFRPEHIDIKEVVAILPAEHKKIIDLIYFEGYSHMEAAKVLAIPLGTVKTRVRHALKILRKVMIEPLVLAA